MKPTFIALMLTLSIVSIGIVNSSIFYDINDPNNIKKHVASCRSVFTNHFTQIHGFVKKIEKCNELSCYQTEMCDKYNENSPPDDKLKNEVDQRVGEISDAYAELKSIYDEISDLNTQISKLKEKEVQSNQKRDDLEYQHSINVNIIREKTILIENKRKEYTALEKQWEADIKEKTLKSQEVEKELVGLKKLYEKETTDVIKEIETYTKSLKGASPRCTAQLNNVLRYLTTYSKKKKILLTVEALEKDYEQAAKLADSEIKSVASTFYANFGKLDDQKFYKMFTSGKFYDMASAKTKQKDYDVNIDDGKEVWTRISDIIEGKFKQTDKLIQDKIKLDITKAMENKFRFKARLSQMVKYAEGIPEHVSKKMKAYEAEFMEISYKTDNQISILLGIELMVAKKLIKAKEIVEKNKLIASGIRHRISIVETFINRIRKSIINQDIKKRKLDSDLNDLEKKHQKNKINYEISISELKKKITQLDIQVMDKCENINKKHLHEEFVKLEEIITRINIDVNKIDAYEEELVKVKNSNIISNLNNLVKDIKDSHSILSAKIAKFFEIAEVLKQSQKSGALSDFECTMIALYQAKEDVKKTCGEVAGLFDTLSNLHSTLTSEQQNLAGLRKSSENKHTKEDRIKNANQI